MSAGSTRRGVCAPLGFKAAAVAAGIKYADRKDLVLVVSETPARAAGLFTRNQLAAAPVELSRRSLQRSAWHRAVLLNAGSANACTGSAGLADAQRLGRAAAGMIGCASSQVLAASTGVIGTRLPVDKMLAALPQAVAQLSPELGLEAAQGIMTTDTGPKLVETSFTLQGTRVTLGGMAKGSGMIHPQMATLLSVVTLDAVVDRPLLARLLHQAGEGTFNAIDVDGQTSTNDTLLVLANGAAGPRTRPTSGPAQRALAEALTEVLDALAVAIVRDGEGASKFLEIVVRQAATLGQARIAARAVGDSLLVKTAMHGQDANWGRVLSAVGATGVALKPRRLRLAFNGVVVVKNGVDSGIPWDRANGALAGGDILIELDLGAGRAQARYRTCDLTARYVAINAEYRS